MRLKVFLGPSRNPQLTFLYNKDRAGQSGCHWPMQAQDMFRPAAFNQWQSKKVDARGCCTQRVVTKFKNSPLHQPNHTVGGCKGMVVHGLGTGQGAHTCCRQGLAPGSNGSGPNGRRAWLTLCFLQHSFQLRGLEPPSCRRLMLDRRAKLSDIL